jgi:hypothetical protein
MSTLVHPPAPPALRVPTRTGSQRLLAGGLAAIALGLVAVALLGPLGAEVVRYRVAETLRNQTIGLDAVSLVVVAPLALLAAALVLRGRALGAALALAVGAYTSYMFVQYILGPDYAGLPGNNERLFPLALFLFAAGWIVALLAWNALDVERLPRAPRRARLIGLLVLPLLALVAFSRYLPQLADWTSGSPQDEGYLAGPTFAWTIAMLDLGVFLPATVAACVGLARGSRWAPKAVYLVAGWFGLVGPAVAAMAIVMSANGDPNASAGGTAFMCVLGLAFVALALAVFWPLCRRLSGAGAGTTAA